MNNLFIMRKSKGMTQVELAKKLNIKSNTLCQYEHGKRSPSIPTLKKIADVLNCKIEDLI